MARGIDADNTAATSATVTQPHWFVRLGFDSVVRLTTASTITWTAQGGSFVQADLEVRMGDAPVIRIFNETASLGVTVLTDGTAGRAVSIWQAYKYDASPQSTLPGYAEPVLLYEGEMGDAAIDDVVSIRCRRTAPQFTPRSYVTAPTFNHTPKPGTIIEMPNQRIILE